ncbi:MAG: hypothetical protein ACOCXJ_05140 [Planctomycetota bacterium]
MPRAALLIAGPAGLDDCDNGQRLIAGAGASAAIAAAPFAPTQLWARVGPDYPEQCRQLLDERRIDHSGLIAEGAATSSRQLRDGTVQHQGPDLPQAEPHDPALLGGCAVIGLPAQEAERAVRVLQALPGERWLLAAVAAAACQREHLLRMAAASDVLIAPTDAAGAALGSDDALATAKILQEAGARCIALSAGPLGGLLLYKQKACTWPADPTTPKPGAAPGAVFAGALAGFLCEHGKIDFRGLKRGLQLASAITGASLGGIGSKRLLNLDRGAYQELFNRLRRHVKA